MFSFRTTVSFESLIRLSHSRDFEARKELRSHWHPYAIMLIAHQVAMTGNKSS